ncbi:heavy metal translocating P-type ATPase [Candidatus Nitrosocosmicus agrestis]|jgi:Cu+-exporting ATPase|uniref:heavy metal translocating P-type ATPase n=1 Tax=Candidatus Nitrosocosmicus agrestis TaxID=2563600 RepID=UPI00122E8C71|nr:heavy metal translocating P-type ATPase [Candidatus Nitrosocosmicus sp. SS]KAA2282928.1 heavy metal translocating P-type ATPase [Candidatus Nitrosocosmicus sp. SS]KAF0869130.1 heavy metal translocating P-type ATPase [Candidatus Nitrosocosmicus sp. SS]MDR4489520.1 heavy metal translocating P-type ATPase [Candidatus Nitrosocosmicus sp.]
MAKDPICGMFVDEEENSIHHTKDGITYYFCASQCLNEFLEPEKALRKLKIHVTISIALTIPIVFLSLPHMIPQLGHMFPMDMMHYTNYLLLALATPIQFWIGWRFYRGFLDGIKARASNMDTLIAIGTTAAYVYSAIVTIIPGYFPFTTVYFETAAIIITLILIGRLLETKTKEKASDAVRKLLDLKPRTARVLRPEIREKNNSNKNTNDFESTRNNNNIALDDSRLKLVTKEFKEIEIPIEEVIEGDIMIIKPGERVPTDGIVVDGFSSVDESAITGESIPVDKVKGDQVIGATINKNGLLKVTASKVGQDTVLSQIITLVEEAKTGKAKLEKMVDQVAKYFVPAIIIIAIGVFLGWYFVGNAGLTYSILAFVSVMIIACPCALGLATPAALMMGSGKGAENGILYKGGEHIEIAGKVNTIVFDKTGTLTEGRPSVTDIISFDQMDKLELLSLVAVAESASEHPLAQAILSKAKEEGVKVVPPESFETVAGYGLQATYSNQRIIIGNRKMMHENNIPIDVSIDSRLSQLEYEGKTAVIVSINNRLSGIIGIADTIKEGAKEVIEKLKSQSIEPIMLTGDNERTAKTVASKIGIDRVIAQVLPHQKEETISDLKVKQNRIVAMVGDGINDAPALARADLGIAIGSGTDVAKETGGIILIKNDLRDVITALELGKKTVSKIKQNLFWAFAYNTGLIPVAAGALVPIFGLSVFGWLPILAGIAMAMSSVTVVTNSLLLGRYTPK